MCQLASSVDGLTVVEKLIGHPFPLFLGHVGKGLVLVGRHQFIQDPGVFAFQHVVGHRLRLGVERLAHLGSASQHDLLVADLVHAVLAQVLARRLIVAFLEGVEDHLVGEWRRLISAQRDGHDAGSANDGLLFIALRPDPPAIGEYAAQVDLQLLNADGLVLAGMLMIGGLKADDFSRTF